MSDAKRALSLKEQVTLMHFSDYYQNLTTEIVLFAMKMESK